MTERPEKPPPPPAATKPRRRSKQHLDALLDQALENTFPASDPVAITEPASEESADRDESDKT
jgi:hypothetical protein